MQLKAEMDVQEKRIETIHKLSPKSSPKSPKSTSKIHSSSK